MKRLLFIYDIEDETLWKDGLWAAVKLLEKDFKVTWWNVAKPQADEDLSLFDFTLGWGGFSSPVERVLKTIPGKKGLCLGGYSIPDKGTTLPYDVLFYETEWSHEWVKQSGAAEQLPLTTKYIHAFGVNTNIYKPKPETLSIWDYITVGAFASWKRQTKLLAKPGPKFAVGQIQKNNLSESVDILGELLLGGVGVSDMVPPQSLARIYQSALACYIPADIMGGGERAVLEARACGLNVEIEPDNPKLQELITAPLWDHHYYYEQLKKGIELVI